MNNFFYQKNCDMTVVDIIQREGITLTKKGKTFMGLCPFHPDKNPSLAVYEKDEYFKCFACGESGDGIAFVMKLKNLTFKQALAYLTKDYQGNKISFKQNQRFTNNQYLKKKKLIKLFRSWESYYHNFLAVIYQGIIQLISSFTSITEVEQFADLYHQLPLVEYQLDILQGSDDTEKLALFRRLAYGKSLC